MSVEASCCYTGLKADQQPASGERPCLLIHAVQGQRDPVQQYDEDHDPHGLLDRTNLTIGSLMVQ